MTTTKRPRARRLTHTLRVAGWLIAVGSPATAMAQTVQPSVASADARELPRVQTNGSTRQLMVDGKPWIALAGEVHNSTASSASYMAPIWDKLAALNLNTVVTPAYWELVEPEEGRFDFALIDEQLRQARLRNLRIVLLWFGTIKNAGSTYAPTWVLADRARFPRAVRRPSTLPFAKGEPPISMFGEAIAAADAHALAALMAHLAKVDAQHTVIAVQIENEAGVLGDSRDRSPAAERAWNAPVPATVLRELDRRRGRLSPDLETLWARSGHRRSGSWAQVFGTDWQAEEAFMAWGVGRFIDRVASAGKAQLRLPMYANAWIGPQKPGEPAGNYPSGGPVPRVFDVWRASAPSIDWLSPDIYVDDFRGWAKAYARPDNPLFVPEAKFIVGNMFVALGEFRAIGFSPFGIEDGLPGNQMAEAYALLRGAIPVLTDAQSRAEVTGFAIAPGQSHEVTLGKYSISVRGQRDALSKMLLDMGVPLPAPVLDRKPQNIGDHPSELTDLRPMGLIARLGADEYLVAGKDLNIQFSPKGTSKAAAIERVEEGNYVEGQWIPGRVLNGDERLRIVPADRFGMVRIRLVPTPS